MPLKPYVNENWFAVIVDYNTIPTQISKKEFQMVLSAMQQAGIAVNTMRSSWWLISKQLDLEPMTSDRLLQLSAKYKFLPPDKSDPTRPRRVTNKTKKENNQSLRLQRAYDNEKKQEIEDYIEQFSVEQINLNRNRA